MISIEKSVVIDQPVDEVFAYITDGSKTPSWQEDLEAVEREGRGRVDLTIGSALDIFGGTGIRYADAVAFNRRVAGAAG